MLSKLVLALCLMASSVVIHASGITWALRRLRRESRPRRAYWPMAWKCIRVAYWLILCHLVEISIWAVFYTSQGAMPDAQSALYFSAVTYTTTGYGDLVLPAEWRLLGGVEALTGILMCGSSTAFFFAVLSTMMASPDSRTAGGEPV